MLGALPLLTLLLAPPALAGPQRLLVQVTVPADLPTGSLSAEITRLGQTTRLALTDDGTAAGDVPGDGVYTGWLTGDAATLSQVVLRDGDTVLYAGTDVTTRAGVDRVGFSLRAAGDRIEAVRAPASLPGAPGQLGAQAGRVAAFGWGAFALLYVAGVLAWTRSSQP